MRVCRRRIALGAVSAIAWSGCRNTVSYVGGPAPSSLSVQAAVASLKVDFPPVLGVPEYQVWATASGGTLAPVASGPGPEIVVTGLVPGTVYQLELRPMGGGPASDRVSGQPLALLHTVPSLVDQGPGGDGLGAALATLDVLGAGFTDLVAGEPFATGNLGALAVFVQSPGAGISNAPSLVTTGAVLGLTGATLSSAGDFNRDGFPDFLVGSPQASSGAGQVQVWLGTGGAPVPGPVLASPSPASGSQYGAAIAVGWLTGPVVAVGAPFHTEGSHPQAGEVTVFSGSAAVFTLTGASDDGHFGTSVALIPDLAGAGGLDLVIGEPGAGSGAGAVSLYRLAGSLTKPSAPDWTATGGAGEALGTRIARGDVDGDGLPDLLLGGGCQGRDIAVYPGRAAALPSPSRSLSLPLPGAACAAGVDQWGLVALDLDGDGIDDVAAGAPISASAGSGLIFRGLPGGPSSVPAWSVSGTSGQFGLALATGDLDGDGFPELVVGSPGVEGSAIPGSVVLYHRGFLFGPLASAGLGLSGVHGSPARPVGASFQDPSATPFTSWTCDWSWGDNSADTVISPCGPATLITPHVYSNAGEFVLRLRVTTDDGRFGEAVAHASIQ